MGLTEIQKGTFCPIQIIDLELCCQYFLWRHTIWTISI